MKYLYLDTETTGVDRSKCAIWQVGCIVEVDERVVATYNVKMDPGPDAFIEDYVARNFHVDRAMLSQFQSKKRAVAELVKSFQNHMNFSDKSDKYVLVGYNVGFDNEFVRKLFTEFNVDFGRFTWSPPVDVMSLAGEFMKSIRKDMPNFKLVTVYNVASMMGLVEKISQDELLSDAHDALFDIELTRRLYKALSFDNVDKVTQVLRKIDKSNGDH